MSDNENSIFPGDNPETAIWNERLDFDQDPLTHLPNRVSTRKTLERLINRCEKNQLKSVAVAYIDLDNFSELNDIDHEYGDEIMRAVATVLTMGFKPTDPVGRESGDEFVVPMPDFPIPVDERQLEELREDKERHLKLMIQEMLKNRSDYVGNKILAAIGATVGIAVYNKGENAEELIRKADREMNRIKKIKHEQRK